jgi:hypothetical protein
MPCDTHQQKRLSTQRNEVARARRIVRSVDEKTGGALHERTNGEAARIRETFVGTTGQPVELTIPLVVV